MRKIILLVFLTSGISIAAQNFDSLMVKRQLDCSDVSYNSALLFEEYYTENKIDSAKNILAYWQGKCGLREPILRAILLIAFKENSFHDSLLTEGILSHVYNYQSRMDMIKYNNYFSYDNYKPYYAYIPVGQEFDKFTKKSFGSLKPNYRTNQVEFVLCEFYSDNYDTIFSRLQTKEYANSIISKEYKKAVNTYLIMPEAHLSWITGVWIPTGNIKRLGIHPELGFQLGVKHKKMNYDLTMAIKFLNSANDYYARRTKTSDLELTNHFLGGHIGVDVGRDIFVKKAHEIQLTCGIAFDGFDALEENKNLDLKSASIWSYNFSFGLGYRYYVTTGFYLGLRAKYNIVDYTLNNIVDFTGNPITVHFIVGSVNNVFRNDNLRSLKYKLRK